MSAAIVDDRSTGLTIERATLTVSEAARRLGLSRSGLYELCRRGEAPGMIKLGRRIVFSKVAIIRLLDG